MSEETRALVMTQAEILMQQDGVPEVVCLPEWLYGCTIKANILTFDIYTHFDRIYCSVLKT